MRLVEGQQLRTLIATNSAGNSHRHR